MAGCHMRFPQNVFGERFLKCSQEELQEKLPSMVSVQMGWSSVKLVSVMVMAGNKSDETRRWRRGPSSCPSQRKDVHIRLIDCKTVSGTSWTTKSANDIPT
ncbi:unnamed protein product [Spirodela intermedia]|uniref:Uncharacterized protein n=1 Tax=Spirodela intermedia TaxID=51605 RepID=A0A7I8LHS7_SPIIN|nr:unnamed protein product [Spirodela intermedia]